MAATIPISPDDQHETQPGAAGPAPTRAERLTLAMRALTPVHEDAAAVAQGVRRPEAAPAREVVLVRAEHARVGIPPARLVAGPRPRRSLSGAVTLVASLAMVFGLLLGAHLTAAPAPAARLPLGGGSPGGQLAMVWYSASGAFTLGIGGGAGPKVKAPGSAGLPVRQAPPSDAIPAQPPQGIGVSPPPFEPWPPATPWMPVPGMSAFAVQPIPGFYTSSFGQCTWWAQYERRDENLTHLGNASDWAAAAAQRGYRVGDQPAPGATVVFQPGVQGAGGSGHVAHVIAVYPGGWFLISEMNFYWNGGGWGRVDYRYAHSGWGVQFIY